MTRSLTELNKLDDNQLQKYFEDNARYMEDAPPEYQYQIRIHAGSLFSEHTHTLREKFFEAVRVGGKTK